MKLSSVLLSKLLLTLKWAINSPIWRENNISEGLFQSRLSFRTEMEQSQMMSSKRGDKRQIKATNFDLSEFINRSVASLRWIIVYSSILSMWRVRPGPTQGLRPWQWPQGLSVIMAATCSTQSLYCKYAFTLKANREREKTLIFPPPPSVSPSSVLQMLGSFCALCKWWVRSGARGLNQAKIRMFPL